MVGSIFVINQTRINLVGSRHERGDQLGFRNLDSMSPPLCMTLGLEDDAVPAMKLTPNAAMRARDVSRPHAEHLAQAEAAEASIARSSPAGRAGTGGPETSGPGTSGRGTGGPGTSHAQRSGTETNGAPADAAAQSAGDRPARAGFPRRRRGPRDRGRRGR